MEESEIKKVVVIGSNSFTGAHFVNYLLEKTDTEVIGISRSEEYDPVLLPYLYKKERSKKFKFYKLDINKDLDKILQIFDEEKPEVIVNYSAQGEVRNSWKWPDQWFETNCMAIVRLANSLKDRSYIKKYIAISTPEVYGATQGEVKESNNFYPSTPYAASKLSGDLFLMTLFKKYNFPVVFMRSSNVYGIHQQLFRIIPRTVIYLKLGKTIEIHGNGKTLRTFVHVRDAADSTWRAIKYGKIGEVYHIAPEGEVISIGELIKMICDIRGVDFNKVTKMVEENFGQDSIYTLDSSKARKELGWKTTISLREGIEEVIKWIEDNWDKIKEMPLDYIHKE